MDAQDLRPVGETPPPVCEVVGYGDEGAVLFVVERDGSGWRGSLEPPGLQPPDWQYHNTLKEAFAAVLGKLEGSKGAAGE